MCNSTRLNSNELGACIVIFAMQTAILFLDKKNE